MIESRNNEVVIVNGLQKYLSTGERPCQVVRQNQVAPIPAYPYVSYTVTSPVIARGGTYSVSRDGVQYKKMQQTWSFTVQSDDADEAMELGIMMYDFFAVSGVTLLADNGIVVDRVGNVTARDNLLTIEYEHRNGLDVTFGLLSTVSPQDETIETVSFDDREIEKPPTADELNELLEKRLDGE